MKCIQILLMLLSLFVAAKFQLSYSILKGLQSNSNLQGSLDTIMVWTLVGFAFVMIAVVIVMADLGSSKDSLLYAKFITSYKQQ